jgi:spermidine synthase
MDRDTWLLANRAALEQRLRWLRDQPDGRLHFGPAGQQCVVVTKTSYHLRLLLVDGANSESDLVQSRLDLRDPLHLLAAYSQAVMLGLAWNSAPRRICVIGLGGGRIPLVLHHHLPSALIDCVEIEPAIVEAATRFFGFQPDDRLRVSLGDGRGYLAELSSGVCYDLIVVDAVGGDGSTAYGLVTQEFYRLCRAHLSGDGVLSVNLLRHYPFYAEKIKTIERSFDHVSCCPVVGGNAVVFATQSVRLDEDELAERIRSLQKQHRFSFSLMKYALALKKGRALQEHLPELAAARVLTDALPPDGYGEEAPSCP